jgi:hypothetical protein
MDSAFWIYAKNEHSNMGSDWALQLKKQAKTWGISPEIPKPWGSWFKPW